MIKHTVTCYYCGKANVVRLDCSDDLVYLDDILKNDGWKKDKYGHWFCNDCSYKNGDN